MDIEDVLIEEADNHLGATHRRTCRNPQAVNTRRKMVTVGDPGILGFEGTVGRCGDVRHSSIDRTNKTFALVTCRLHKTP